MYKKRSIVFCAFLGLDLENYISEAYMRPHTLTHTQTYIPTNSHIHKDTHTNRYTQTHPLTQRHTTLRSHWYTKPIRYIKDNCIAWLRPTISYFITLCTYLLNLNSQCLQTLCHLDKKKKKLCFVRAGNPICLAF